MIYCHVCFQNYGKFQFHVGLLDFLHWSPESAWSNGLRLYSLTVQTSYCINETPPHALMTWQWWVYLCAHAVFLQLSLLSLAAAGVTSSSVAVAHIYSLWSFVLLYRHSDPHWEVNKCWTEHLLTSQSRTLHRIPNVCWSCLVKWRCLCPFLSIKHLCIISIDL